jgi:outer membrane protein
MSVKFGLRLCLVGLALASLSRIAPAQTAGQPPAQTKVAVINLQKAVLESDEIKKASTELEAKFKPRQQELEKLQNDIQVIQQQLQTNAGKLNPQAEADLNAQGARKQRDLQRKTEDLQGDVDRERNEILGKSTQKMGEVVKKLAEEKGYDLVVDVSNTIYFKPALDITSEAMTAYNKAYPVK